MYFPVIDMSDVGILRAAKMSSYRFKGLILNLRIVPPRVENAIISLT